MSFKNQEEILTVIRKIYKALDKTYVDYLSNCSYNYASQLVDASTVNATIMAALSEDELNVLVTALSDNEIEINKLISDNASLNKFFARLMEANTKPVIRGIISAHTSIKESKRRQETIARKRKESHELYKAARLTPRQKQVLTTLGMPIANYEKKTT